MTERSASQGRADEATWRRSLADRPDPLPRGVLEAEGRCLTCRGYGVVDGFFGSVSRCEDCDGKGLTDLLG